MQKKVSTVQLAFSLACCRNVGQLWQRAQCVAGGTGGLWAVPGAGGRQELAGASCFQCWRAAACCSWRSRAPLPGARLQKAKWSFCSWAPSCCYFPLSPGSEEGSLQWAVEQSGCWLCGSAGSCCVASLPSWQVQAPLLSCLDLSLWGHHQSHFPPSFSQLLLQIPAQFLKQWKAKHCIIQSSVHKRNESSRWLLFFPIPSTD